jgi:hypothetical protein
VENSGAEVTERSRAAVDNSRAVSETLVLSDLPSVSRTVDAETSVSAGTDAVRIWEVEKCTDVALTCKTPVDVRSREVLT